MGLLLILALAGAALALAATQKPVGKPSSTSASADQSQQIVVYAQIPAALVPRFVEAFRSGDAQTAYAVAAWFRAQGYPRAADILTQAANSVAKPQATAAPQPAPGATPAPAAASSPGVLPTPTTQVAPSEAAQIAAYAEIPTALVPQFVEAIKSGSPQTAQATAAWFRAQGYTQAADLLSQAAGSVKPPAAPAAAAPAAPSAPPSAASSAASPPLGAASTAASVSAPAIAPVTPSFSLPTPANDVSVPPAIVGPAAATTPTATQAATATTPGRDPPLPASIKTLLENVLRTAHDPQVIYQAADMLQASGYPNTAAELRKRAVAIASSQVDPIAVVQDILQQADAVKPPAATSPAIPPGALPQYPTTTPQAAPTATTPGVSINIPTQINVPVSTSTATAQVPPAAAAGTRYYVVESGDNPSKIAKKFTGDPNRWREMATLNPEANLAAGKIYPGQRLLVPTAWPNTAAAGPIVSVPVAPTAASAVPSARPSAGASSTGGYDANLARSLAPSVLKDVATNGDKYVREQLKTFQRAAGLPADGDYGPKTAGAVEYFASATAPPALPKYGTGTKPYAPPRSTPPMQAEARS